VKRGLRSDRACAAAGFGPAERRTSSSREAHAMRGLSWDLPGPKRSWRTALGQPASHALLFAWWPCLKPTNGSSETFFREKPARLPQGTAGAEAFNALPALLRLPPAGCHPLAPTGRLAHTISYACALRSVPCVAGPMPRQCRVEDTVDRWVKTEHLASPRRGRQSGLTTHPLSVKVVVYHFSSN